MGWRLQLVLFALCLTMNLYLFVKCRLKGHESWLDVFFKMFGSNYFCLFIIHRINLQIINYQEYPGQFSFLAWVNWFLVLMLFLFFMGAYLTRSNPVLRANRLREILFPLFCGTLPMLITESFSFNGYEFVKSQAMLGDLFKPMAHIFPGYWSGLSIALIIGGHAIAVWAIFHLRRSFGIFTEVRTLITSGPYRYVRHPIYVGESFATIGLCDFYPSLFNIAVTIVFLVSQRIRAHFEEQKFLHAIPEYKIFMEKAGAYWPRLRKN